MKTVLQILGIIILFFAGIRIFNTFNPYLGFAVCGLAIYLIYYIFIFKRKNNEKNL